MPDAGVNPKFSVIMPAYNEARHLGENVAETQGIMDQLGESYEIIVVDDGSQDRTGDVAREVASRNPKVQAVVLPVNQGKGNALRAGFSHSCGELIFFLDADLDLHPRQVSVLHRIMQEEGADVVIGSKRHPQTVLNYPWRRRVVSAVYFFLVKLLFGLPIRDTQTGIKLFKRDVLAKIFPKVLVKKYAFDLEVLVVAHHNHFRIAEAPVVVNYKGKFGHIGVRTIFNIGWDTLAVWYRLVIKRYYDEKN